MTPDGPSARAGLQSGDLVLKVNGHAVTSANDLTRQVALARAGETIRLDIRRDGAVRQIAVRSGTRPSDLTTLADASASGAPGAALGLQVAPRQGGGVKVEGVAPGSPAADRGVRPGDIIERVGERPVNSAADVHAAVADAHNAHHKEILLRMSRGGQHLFVPLPMPGANG